MKNNRRRIHLIDEVRGLSIILMVFYHAFYMLGDFFGLGLMYDARVFFEPLQPAFACIFIFISGISSNLSRSNFKRGIRLLGIALGFTLVTAVILPVFDIHGAEIYFGILHLLSVSMLVYALLRPLLKKLPTAVGLLSSLAVFVLTYTVPKGRFLWLDVPESVYELGFLAPLGFPSYDFYSADYFPLIPFLFMFIAGTFFGRLASDDKLPGWWYTQRCKPLAAVGGKTLIIYILHWPIIFLLGLIISKF